MRYTRNEKLFVAQTLAISSTVYARSADRGALPPKERKLAINSLDDG